MSDRYNFYAVRNGRKPGIYDSWADAKEQVCRYPNSQHKGFDNFNEVLAYLENGNQYLIKDLKQDLETSYLLTNNANLIKEISDNFEGFTQKQMLLPPSESLSRMILTPQILKEIGVDTEMDLEYVKGAFKVNKVVDLRKYSKQFITNDITEKGGYIVLGNTTRFPTLNRDKVDTPENWYNRSFPPDGKEFLYHRGHTIAKSFQRYSRSQEIKYNINKKCNIFVSTNWMNHGNHSMDNYGVNQTYIENSILNILESTQNIRINYRAKLLFHGNERVPRGIHIQAEFYGKISEQRPIFNTLNIFIPNIDPRFIVDYSRKY